MSHIIYFVIILILTIQTTFAATTDSKSLISVTGEATIDIIPDEAHITMSIEINDTNLSNAQDKSDTISANTLKLLKNKLHIEEQHIQTHNLSIRPVYQYNTKCQLRPCPPNLTHYESKKTITVILKDITKLQDLLERAVDIGITNIKQVTFTSSKLKALKIQAQTLAAKNAHFKATKIANALGVNPGKPHTINVTHTTHTNQMKSLRTHSMASESITQPDPTIALGQMQISATINVDFELIK